MSESVIKYNALQLKARNAGAFLTMKITSCENVRGTSLAALTLDIFPKDEHMAEAINRDELQTLAHNGAQIVEVLGTKEYEHAHIAGAINLPLAKLNRESASALIRDRMVILYCYDYQ